MVSVRDEVLEAAADDDPSQLERDSVSDPTGVTGTTGNAITDRARRIREQFESGDDELPDTTDTPDDDGSEPPLGGGAQDEIESVNMSLIRDSPFSEAQVRAAKTTISNRQGRVISTQTAIDKLRDNTSSNDTDPSGTDGGDEAGDTGDGSTSPQTDGDDELPGTTDPPDDDGPEPPLGGGAGGGAGDGSIPWERIPFDPSDLFPGSGGQTPNGGQSGGSSGQTPSGGQPGFLPALLPALMDSQQQGREEESDGMNTTQLALIAGVAAVGAFVVSEVL